MLILSDVCDTLIDLNSTYDYIKFLYIHGFGNKIIWWLLNNKLFNVFLYIIKKFTKIDLQRLLTFEFFRWIPHKQLNDINKDFRKFYISKKTKILDLMENYIKNENEVILVSASINIPIDMLSKYLGCKSYSSKLEKINWIYTWKVMKDLLQNKESIIYDKKLDISKYNSCQFYTDNLTDIWFIVEIQKNIPNSKFSLVLKSNKQEWLSILSVNKIINYEFIY